MHLIKIIFFFFLSTLFIHANSIDINLISPKNNFKSPKELVLFKGTVIHVKRLLINGLPIPIYNNRFYIKALLNPHQENKFVIEAIGHDNQKKVINRIIDYFPSALPEQKELYSISNIQFHPLSNTWQIQGAMPFVKTIYINNKHIPVLDNKTFEYRFSPNQLQLNYLNITGISKDLFLFSHQVGLYDTRKIEQTQTAISNKSPYKPIESAILSSYYNMHWQLKPFTTIQEKMIQQLIQEKHQDMSIEHIKLLQKSNHIVVSIPYLNEFINIQEISYQLKLILQNTIDTSSHITLLWYNNIPNILEVIYNQNSAPYWVIDDQLFEYNTAAKSKSLSTFKSYHF